MLEGEQLPGASPAQRAAPSSRASCPRSSGGGRFLQMDDVGKPNVVISTKIARDYPNADGTPKKVGDRIAHRRQAVQDHRPLRDGLAHDRR